MMYAMCVREQAIEMFHVFVNIDLYEVPPGKRLHTFGKSPCIMGKSTMHHMFFHSYASLPEGKRFTTLK